MYGGSDTSKGVREEQQRQEADIRAAQKGIEQQFAGFDDSFYKGREKAYLDFALPELAEQYQAAQKNLSYSLAAKGLLRSGAAGTLSTSLERELHKKKQAVADTAISQARGLRTNVEQEKNTLLAQAMQALDPGATVVAARKTAAGFTEPSTFSSIGNVFEDWSNIYATKRAASASYSEPLTFGANKDASYTKW